MIDFLPIGFEAYVNVNKVRLISAIDAEKLRREMKKRGVEKTSERYWDACGGKTIKSTLLLDDGMIVVSAIGADTLIKRFSEIKLGGNLK